MPTYKSSVPVTIAREFSGRCWTRFKTARYLTPMTRSAEPCWRSSTRTRSHHQRCGANALSRTRHDPIGGFWRFWNLTLLDKSSDQHLAELLDSLHEDASRLIPALEQSRLGALPVELLARCLEAKGDNHEPAQLYDWLATAGSSLGRSHRKEKPLHRVRAWLEERPEVLKKIFLTWLRQRDPDDSLRPLGYWFCEALHDSTPPPDFGLWCLNQAIEVSGTEPDVSQALLWQAYRSLQSTTGMGLTPETLRERTHGHPALAQHLDELRAPRSSRVSAIEDEHRRKMDELERQWDEERRQEARGLGEAPPRTRGRAAGEQVLASEPAPIGDGVPR